MHTMDAIAVDILIIQNKAHWALENPLREAWNFTLEPWLKHTVQIAGVTAVGIIGLSIVRTLEKALKPFE